MDTDPTTALIKQWRSNSKQHTSRLKSVNRSKCFDGQRQLHVGMAAAYASCADQLEAAKAESEVAALPVNVAPTEFVPHE